MNEIRAHVKNESWAVTKKTDEMELVDFKMGLGTKVGPDGESKRKARLVARGFTQRPEIDYEKIYAPTTKLSSVLTILALAVEESLKLWQLDVTMAHLNGD